jgi:hypothetical protein
MPPMVEACTFLTLDNLLFSLLIAIFLLKMFCMSLALNKILFPFIALHMTTMCLLNTIHMFFRSGSNHEEGASSRQV